MQHNTEFDVQHAKIYAFPMHKAVVRTIVMKIFTDESRNEVQLYIIGPVPLPYSFPEWEGIAPNIHVTFKPDTQHDR